MSFTPICPGVYGAGPANVDRPTVNPWKYGLYSVATVIDDTNDHERNGIVYKSPPCTADVRPWVDACSQFDVTPKSPTDIDADSVIRGCPLHLYAALDCKSPTLESMIEEIQLVFNLGEQRALEATVWNNVLAVSGALVLNASSLPADAFTVVGGFSALESAMASTYGGQATIHADRGIAPFAADHHQIVPVGEHYETKLGSPVAFYGGSPNTSPAGVIAPSGYAWMYATSDITIRRFPATVLPESVDQFLKWGQLTNVPYVLCERTYVPSIECPLYAVLVCLNGSC